jgi:hypothetical protein
MIGFTIGLVTGILVGILIITTIIKPHKRGADYYFERHQKNKTARRP